MTYHPDDLKVAHRAAADHRELIGASALCGCFYCQTTFDPEAITEWLNERSGTAFCPHCGIDSVLPEAAGLPVREPAFIADMHNYWFERGTRFSGSGVWVLRQHLREVLASVRWGLVALMAKPRLVAAQRQNKANQVRA